MADSRNGLIHYTLLSIVIIEEYFCTEIKVKSAKLKQRGVIANTFLLILTWMLKLISSVR